VSPRVRLYGAVILASLAAAGLTVGVTLATRTATPKRPPAHRGLPPFSLELGVRTDPEAMALRRAASLYDAGKAHEAGLIFDRYHSVEAEVGADLSVWPEGFPELRQLAATFPRSSFAQLNYGLALYWRGEEAAAAAAWRTARAAQPDTPYAIRAEDLLHPNFPRGLPTFVPSFPAPAGLGRLAPPRQLASLARDARAGGVRDKLLYGVALQRLGHQLSALRQYEAAAAIAPGDAEPRVAVAVARFDKGDPSRAFSRLGPLARRYPKSQTVRFHLGLCLLWLGSVKEAKHQLGLAQKAGPRTTLGVEAGQFLARLKKVGTLTTAR
jgi:tetratricopeptide (TPR) repeat protein